MDMRTEDTIYRTEETNRLISSETLSADKFREECYKMYGQIRGSEFDSIVEAVIHSFKPTVSDIRKYFYGRDRLLQCRQTAEARNRLISSEYFSVDKFRIECYKLYIQRQIRAGDIRVGRGRLRCRQTNLHAAVMEGNLEKTLCIVEIHKQGHGHIAFHINLRDSRGKTVLDYAKENNCSLSNDLLIAYLEENNAKSSIRFT